MTAITLLLYMFSKTKLKVKSSAADNINAELK